MKIKITKILNNTITHKLDRILMKFPPYERFVFWTGLNLRNSPSISKSKSIKNNPIKTLIIWSKTIKDKTGRRKGFICLILTPPSNSYWPLYLQHPIIKWLIWQNLQCFLIFLPRETCFTHSLYQAIWKSAKKS